MPTAPARQTLRVSLAIRKITIIRTSCSTVEKLRKPGPERKERSRSSSRESRSGSKSKTGGVRRNSWNIGAIKPEVGAATSPADSRLPAEWFMTRQSGASEKPTWVVLRVMRYFLVLYRHRLWCLASHFVDCSASQLSINFLTTLPTSYSLNMYSRKMKTNS